MIVYHTPAVYKYYQYYTSYNIINTQYNCIIILVVTINEWFVNNTNEWLVNYIVCMLYNIVWFLL